MKKHLQIFTILLLLAAQQTLQAQDICNPSGNILIYSNYDGGDFTINIDENIPNLRIGLCSYADFHVTITGAYSSNVVEVLYAGYNADYTTSVTGVDAGIVTILNFPPVTLFDVDGYGYMICAYECDSTFVPGGCNTVDQATDYFLSNLDGEIRSSYYQYGAYSGTYNMSDGGNCCFGAVEPCFIAVGGGQDGEICIGDSVQLKGTGALTYSWTPAIGLSDAAIAEPYASPETTTTYIVFGTDADGCTGTDTVTVFVYPYPVVTITEIDWTVVVATGGGTYQWYCNGALIVGATNDTLFAYEFLPDVYNGDFYVEVTSDEGCTTISEEIYLQFESIANNYYNQFVSCYPNPVTDVLTIIADQLLNIEYIELFNVAGQKIEIAETVFSNTTQLNLQNVTSGIYTVKIITDKGIVVKQIIVN